MRGAETASSPTLRLPSGDEAVPHPHTTGFLNWPARVLVLQITAKRKCAGVLDLHVQQPAAVSGRIIERDDPIGALRPAMTDLVLAPHISA